MKRIVKKHPLAIRWFHWINFPVLTIMIWSGLLIYWANDIYRLGWGDKTLIKFFPQSFYDALHIPFRLATGMAFHFFFMWFFFLNGLLYVLYTLFSGEWRYLLPNRHSFKEAWQVVLHDLHIRKTTPPQDKYNAAQRIAYSSIIVMGFGSIITGIAIYKPIQFYWLCALCGGYEAARIEHFILVIGYVLFFVVHIGQVILAGWNNFQAMVTGFEVEKINDPAPQSEVTETIHEETTETITNELPEPAKQIVTLTNKEQTTETVTNEVAGPTEEIVPGINKEEITETIKNQAATIKDKE